MLGSELRPGRHQKRLRHCQQTYAAFHYGFGVRPLGELATHSTLQTLLKQPRETHNCTRAVKPASLHKLLEAKLKTMVETKVMQENEVGREKTPKEQTQCRQDLMLRLHTAIDEQLD